MRHKLYEFRRRPESPDRSLAEQTSCWKPLSTLLYRSPEIRAARPAPTALMAKAAMLERAEPFSFLPFCKFTRHVMNLRRPWRIDAPKIQSFLEQTKSA